MGKAKASKTKEKLLKAALELFSEKGYLGATTKEIAQRASVSELTLFRHFKNKENLFISVLDYYSFLPKLKELIRELESKPLNEALFEIARAFLNQLKSKKALVRIMHTEISRYPEDIKRAYQGTIAKIHEELALYFKNCQDNNLIKELSPILLSQAFLGLFFSYFMLKELKNMILDENLSENTIIEKYVEIFLHG
ncbi:MAG: TetR/AcrR family transcriptional regulator, partial [Caldimicrobium sp.]